MSSANPGYMKRIASFAILFLVVLLLAGCDQEPADKPLQYSGSSAGVAIPTYTFAVHPLHNPQKLSEAYQPLVDHLNRQLHGAQIELEASRDYQAYEKKFRSRDPAILLPNPWQTLQAMKVGYHVVAMAGDSEDFKGCLLYTSPSPRDRTRSRMPSSA